MHKSERERIWKVGNVFGIREGGGSAGLSPETKIHGGGLMQLKSGANEILDPVLDVGKATNSHSHRALCVAQR